MAIVRRADSMARSSGRLFPATRLYRSNVGTATATATTEAIKTVHGTPNTKSPRWNTSSRYLNRNSNNDSIAVSGSSSR